jgi:hypothetical protein
MSFFDRLFRRHAVADGTIRDTATRVFINGTEFRVGIDILPTGTRMFIGDGLYIISSQSAVIGNRCTVHADSCHLFGNNAIVKGSRCVVDGDGCTVTGDDCIVYGKGCRVNGRRSTVYPYTRTVAHLCMELPVPDCNSPATCIFISDTWTLHGAGCPLAAFLARGSANATVFDVDHEDVEVNNDARARDQVCVVCLSNARSIAAIPCLHVALCHECCAGLKDSGARDLATGLHLCTQCRRGVERFGHIYN